MIGTHVHARALLTALASALLLAAPAAAAPGPVGAPARAPEARGGWTVSAARVATRDGLRPIVVSTPATWSLRHRGAVLVVHGAASSVAGMQRVSGLDAEATRAGLAVVDLVALPAPTTGWNAGSCCFSAAARRLDDVGYVAAAVTWLRDRWGIPSSAITLVGYSNGGMLGYRAVCERPGLVGRLVVVEGARLVPCTASTRPTALVAVHGDADTTVPLAGTRWQPWLRTSVPSARTSIAGLAVRNRCTAWTQRRSGAVTTVEGVGCAAPVRLLVVHGLTHRWTRSSLLDETAVAVAAALGRPLPVG